MRFRSAAQACRHILLEKGVNDMSLKNRFREDVFPFISALIFGLAAHMYMLTNKLPVDDDICFFFSKGATVRSGRYTLELLPLLMPDVSMPWIYGLMALLFISAAVCLTVRLFSVKSSILKLMIAGLFITFPAETGTISYMFTCAPYALALLMAIGSVYIFREYGCKLRWFICILLLVLSCGIYQGYFAFAASFCVLLLIKDLISGGKKPSAVFKDAVVMLSLLLVSAGIYGLSVVLAGKLSAVPVLDVVNKEQGLLTRIGVAYSAYMHTFFSGYFAYVNTPFSRVLHLLLAALTAAGLISFAVRCRDMRRVGLLALCVVLLPLASYCLYLLADNSYIHSLALYPFASVYILFVIVIENCLKDRRKVWRNVAAAAMALIIFTNIYFANSFYLRSQLQYENRKAFYTTMLTRVMQTEGFSAGSKLAIIGNESSLEYDHDGSFDFSSFQLPGSNITSLTHAEDIISIYLGCDIPFADEKECAALAETEEVRDMPCYPYYGSVRSVGQYIIVKFE